MPSGGLRVAVVDLEAVGEPVRPDRGGRAPVNDDAFTAGYLAAAERHLDELVSRTVPRSMGG